MVKRNNKKLINYFIVGLISVIAVFILEYPLLFGRYRVEYDSLTYAMPEISQMHHIPGTKVLSILFGWLPKEFFIRFTPLILIFITSVFAFKVGSKLKDEKLGFLIAALTAFFLSSTDWIAGFNPRGFAFPIMAAFVYYFISGRGLQMGACIMAGALFYPVIFPILAAAALLQTIIKGFDKKIFAPIIISVMLSVVFFVVFCINYAYFEADIYSYDEIMGMQEFSKGAYAPLHILMSYDTNYILSSDFIETQLFGRPLEEKGNYYLFYLTTISLFLALLGLLAFKKRKSIKLNALFPPLILVSTIINIQFGVMSAGTSLSWGFFLLSMSYFLNRKPPKIPREVYLILFVSFIGFLLVYSLYPVFSLNLYFANRLLKTTVFMVLPVFAGLAAYKNMNKRLNALSFVLCAILLVVFLSNKGPALYECGDVELYSAISGFNESALIAGHPEQMNCVPFFSGKRVLVNQLSSHAEARKLWEIKKNELYAVFGAFYSEKYKDIGDFCKAYNVSYMVIGKHYFSEEYLSKKQLYSVPIFNDFIRERASNKSFEKLVQVIPEDKLIPINEGLVIVSCG